MAEDSFTFFQYSSMNDLLTVILYSSQSLLATAPLLHHINHKNREILFIQTVGMGGNVVHYHITKDIPKTKLIELKRLSGEFSFVGKIGSDAMSMYVPILELEQSTFNFP